MFVLFLIKFIMQTDVLTLIPTCINIHSKWKVTSVSLWYKYVKSCTWCSGFLSSRNVHFFNTSFYLLIFFLFVSTSLVVTVRCCDARFPSWDQCALIWSLIKTKSICPRACFKLQVSVNLHKTDFQLELFPDKSCCFPVKNSSRDQLVMCDCLQEAPHGWQDAGREDADAPQHQTSQSHSQRCRGGRCWLVVQGAMTTVAMWAGQLWAAAAAFKKIRCWAAYRDSTSTCSAAAETRGRENTADTVRWSSSARDVALRHRLLGGRCLHV